MNFQCPTCARSYELGSAPLPAKLRCEGCGTKCLAEVDGSLTILESGQLAPERPQAPAPRVIVAGGRKGGPSWSGVAAALLVFGGGAAVLGPRLLEREAEPARPAPAEVAAPKAPVAAAEAQPAKVEVKSAPAPAPANVADTPAAPEVTPTPGPGKPAAAPAVTLEQAAPEIARVLQATLAKLPAEPARSEEEARVFLRALFAKVQGKSRAASLAQDHPGLLVGVLADLWAGIEAHAGARLPAANRISIRLRSASRATDLTAAYLAQFTPPAPGQPVAATAWQEMAVSPEVAKLLHHFATAEDSGTVDNALVLGRMAHAFRSGKVPLADSPAGPVAAGPDQLPDVKKSVNLANFKDVRELVGWAHGFNPSPKEKVNVSLGSEAERTLARVKAYLALPPEALLAHPGAAGFPGAVAANAPRVEKEVTIDLNLPRWQATGLYAAPGEAVTVAVPVPLRKLGLKLRIGANTDNVLKTGGEKENNLSRFPLVSREVALDDARVTAGNPFGGAIYIDVPWGENGGDVQVPAHGWTIRAFDKLPEPEKRSLSIAGAVEMAWWRAGMTPSAWKDELKKPAPWAEMELGKLHTCVPRDQAAEVRDPAELAGFWQQVLDAQWKFGGYPGHRHIPQRVSFDRQISAGFMHSGYPIMVHLPQVDEVLDLKKLQTGGSWGLYHEIGHNHQPICITPGGFTESTVNLYTLATMKATLPKRDPLAGHSALSDPDALLKKRRAGEGDAWAGLAVFLPLIEEFGYESLSKTLASYWEDARKDRGAIQLADEDRQDQWALRFGEVVQKDVSDYFESVRFKVTPATRKKLSKYEAWAP